MRLKVTLLADKPQILPINYPYNLASMIYRRIQRGDAMLSLYLHQPKTIKFFTFSKLMAKKRKIIEDKLEVEGEIYFEFSSPKKEIVVALVNGLLEKPEIEIKDAKFFQISSLEINNWK